MISKSSLTRRLSAIEDRTTDKPATVCMFLMPGEDMEAALASRFGAAGVPRDAKLLMFTWQPTQDTPEQGMTP